LLTAAPPWIIALVKLALRGVRARDLTTVVEHDSPVRRLPILDLTGNRSVGAQ
jgi:hypothetical protein